MDSKLIIVDEPYQTDYSYQLTQPVGKNFEDDFSPDLTPAQMLKLGIFGGNYFSKIPAEFPNEWFDEVKLAKNGKANPKLNYFLVNASQPLKVWQEKGWIYPNDPLGWFLWYCRYYYGRRIKNEDVRQIKRWKAIKRHAAQIKANCSPTDLFCRPKQRQALLHWAYDSRKI